MKTNELKKGDEVILDCGWKAIIQDNRKGDIRTAEVYGMYTEVGSVYAHDIRYYKNKEGKLISIVHTPKQVQLKRRVDAL